MPGIDEVEPVTNPGLVAPLNLENFGNDAFGSDADSESSDLEDEVNRLRPLRMTMVAGGGLFVLGVLGIWLYLRKK